VSEAEVNKQGPSTTRSNEPLRKKPYLKPAFQHERVFETMALSCGKVQSSQANCRSNRKTS